MRAAVVTFPGSNCDQDARHALEDVLGALVEMVWHTREELDEHDLIILPGGFSYGDYLRSGAIASTAPVLRAVRRAAARGAYVLGICNGFQVLCEAGLLPGALVRNDTMRFTCRHVDVAVSNAETAFTRGLLEGELLSIPIAHGEGCFVAQPDVLERIESNGQVVLRYAGDNPNGSMHDIAAVMNERGNVLGMMPHPERATSELLGSADGRAIFTSIAEVVGAHAHA